MFRVQGLGFKYESMNACRIVAFLSHVLGVGLATSMLFSRTR